MGNLCSNIVVIVEASMDGLLTTQRNIQKSRTVVRSVPECYLIDVRLPREICRRLCVVQRFVTTYVESVYTFNVR
jgi:hypothetical protein